MLLKLIYFIRISLDSFLDSKVDFGCCSDICVWLLRISKHSSLDSYQFSLRNPNVCNHNFIPISNFIIFLTIWWFSLENVMTHDDSCLSLQFYLNHLYFGFCTTVWESEVVRFLSGNCSRTHGPVANQSRLRTWPENCTMINSLSKYTNGKYRFYLICSRIMFLFTSSWRL